MARNWIKIETVTPGKPEVCVMATQLRLDPDMVMGKLVRLWSWAEVNRINGNDLGVTREFLDKLAGKKGFAAAMERCGWLREEGDKLVFSNFQRHNGPSGKGRALTAMRVARHRERKRDCNDETEASAVSDLGGIVTKSILNHDVAQISQAISFIPAPTMSEEVAEGIPQTISPFESSDEAISKAEDESSAELGAEKEGASKKRVRTTNLVRKAPVAESLDQPLLFGL